MPMHGHKVVIALMICVATTAFNGFQFVIVE